MGCRSTRPTPHLTSQFTGKPVLGVLAQGTYSEGALFQAPRALSSQKLVQAVGVDLSFAWLRQSHAVERIVFGVVEDGPPCLPGQSMVEVSGDRGGTRHGTVRRADGGHRERRSPIEWDENAGCGGQSDTFKGITVWVSDEHHRRVGCDQRLAGCYTRRICGSGPAAA